MNPRSLSSFRILLVATIVTAAIAGDTRYYGSNLGGAGLGLGGSVGAGHGLGGVGVGGIGGIGGIGGLGVVGIGGVGVGGSYGSSSGSCRYWCRTPQGQAYCCEDGNEVASLPTVKPGQCPPVRPQCPPTRAGFRPPQQCSNDSRCPGTEKCCFDTCLQHHTCKAPLSTYG
ncbi:unnamed protein product [Meganyctiphanes norvegica]|uniref:WAP domain-containing protein n=1 Tax=Meganyctiphanes norvegica TaxID=48144 RepID=A0AAV2R6J6_MEGNR